MLGEDAQVSDVGLADDDGVVGVVSTDEGDYTVIAGRGALEAAVVAGDNERTAHGRHHSRGVRQRTPGERLFQLKFVACTPRLSGHWLRGLLDRIGLRP